MGVKSYTVLHKRIIKMMKLVLVGFVIEIKNLISDILSCLLAVLFYFRGLHQVICDRFITFIVNMLENLSLFFKSIECFIW